MCVQVVVVFKACQEEGQEWNKANLIWLTVAVVIMMIVCVQVVAVFKAYQEEGQEWTWPTCLLAD